MTQHTIGAAGPPRRHELGETDNPRALIPGNPADLRAYAAELRDHSATHALIETALRDLPVTQHWIGQAADNYIEIAVARVKRHQAAAESTNLAARTIADYADGLAAAQRRAGEAIDLHDNTNTNTHSDRDRDANRSSAVDMDARRAEARQLLDHARAQLAALADDARAQIRRAYETLPAPRPLLTPIADRGSPHTVPASLDTATPPAGGRTVTVRPGDTLSGLADRYLRDGSRWPEIAKLNPEIKDPDLIFPGQRLVLPAPADDDRDPHNPDPHDDDRDHDGSRESDQCDPSDRHDDHRNDEPRDDDQRPRDSQDDNRQPSGPTPRDSTPPDPDRAPEQSETPTPPAPPPSTPLPTTPPSPTPATPTPTPEPTPPPAPSSPEGSTTPTPQVQPEPTPSPSTPAPTPAPTPTPSTPDAATPEPTPTPTPTLPPFYPSAPPPQPDPYLPSPLEDSPRPTPSAPVPDQPAPPPADPEPPPTTAAPTPEPQTSPPADPPATDATPTPPVPSPSTDAGIPADPGGADPNPNHPGTGTDGPTPGPGPGTPADPDQSRNPGLVAHEGDNSDSGIDLGTGLFVVGGIAAVAAAAVLLARRRDAAQSAAGSPTSGRRDAALPPIVRQLGHAYLQRTTSRRADLPPRLDTPVPSASAPAGAPTPAPAHVRRSARFAVPVGRTPDGGPARVDLAATPALALDGARRTDVARAILLACLNPHAQPDGPLAHVVIPAADAAHLLDDLPSLPTPPGLHIVNHLDTALDELERWPRAGQGSPPLVLIATAPPGQTDPAERLQQILTTKRRHVAAVLLGDWPTPVAIHAGPDAAIHATTAYPILPIATRLFTTPLPDARDLLAALATPPHPTTEQPDRAEPDDPPTAPIPVIESGDPDDQQHDNTDTTEPVPANHDPGDGDDPGSGDHEPDEGDTETTDASADAGRPSGGGLANETDATSNPGEEPATAETHDTDAKQAESPSHPIHPTDPGGGPSSRKALTIEVFGRLQVYVHPDGSDPIDIAGQLSGRRQRELLTYLAVHPDGARRDLLITDLWADNARGNLHSGIRRLRTALAPHAHGEPVILGPEDDHYRFNPAQIDVDYWRFDAASTHHRTARTDTERAEAARQIISIYQSDLAPALSAEWIEPLRAHANRTAIDAADSLARHLYHNGDTDQAVGVLEHATTVIGPYAESLYQLLIQLQRKQGRPKAAARTLEALIDRLAAIDAAPSEATIALARQ